MRVIRILIIVALGTFVAAGQVKKSPAKPKPTPVATATPAAKPEPSPPVVVKKVESFTDRSFDASVDALPRSYSGHDFISIFNALKARTETAKKGEFETTEAFRQRVEREQKLPIFGSLGLDSVYAFTTNDVEAVYNADEQAMNVALDVGRVWGMARLESDGKSIKIKIESKTSSYEASNSYGAKTMIDKTHGNFYEVAVDNWQTFNVSRYLPKFARENGFTSSVHFKDAIQARIPMDIPTAMKAKDNLRVLIICRLKEPYFKEGGNYKKAMMTDPKEIYMFFNYLNAEVSELWFYDRDSGQVFLKIKS